MNWAVWSEDNGARTPIGSFNQQVGGVNLADLANAIDDPSSVDRRRLQPARPSALGESRPTA